MGDVKAEHSFAQITSLLPMLLPALGVPKEKAMIIAQALQAPDAMIGNQPNMAALMKLKSDLQAFDEQAAANGVQVRVVCGKCRHCNTINL